MTPTSPLLEELRAKLKVLKAAGYKASAKAMRAKIKREIERQKLLDKAVK